MKVTLKIENIEVNVNITKETDYIKLKEQLRDTLCPVITDKNRNWGAIVERIRDMAIPQLSNI